MHISHSGRQTRKPDIFAASLVLLFEAVAIHCYVGLLRVTVPAGGGGLRRARDNTSSTLEWAGTFPMSPREVCGALDVIGREGGLGLLYYIHFKKRQCPLLHG